MIKDKIVLGTVQLGVPYGRNAGSPLCTEMQADELLQAAWELGVRVFDTALGYGLSIARLANWLKKNNRMALCSIVTKISPECCKDKKKIGEAVEPFFGAFSITVLTHGFVNSNQWNCFRTMAAEFGCNSGQSVYTVEEVIEANRLGADLIQAPGNILDRRQINICRNIKQKLDIRSIFLQGVLLDPPDVANSRVPGLGPIVKKIQNCAQSAGLSTTEALIGLMLQELKPAWRMVLGADNSNEVKQWSNSQKSKEKIEEFKNQVEKELEVDISDTLLDPRCWPQIKDKLGAK